jgi:hypothetical protein
MLFLYHENAQQKIKLGVECTWRRGHFAMKLQLSGRYWDQAQNADWINPQAITSQIQSELSWQFYSEC